MFKNRFAKLMILCVVVSVASCKETTATDSFDIAQRDFQLRVTSVSPHARPAFLVGNVVPGDATSAKVVWLQNDTKIFMSNNAEGWNPVSIADIAVGTTVSIKTTGLELRSQPPQYYAVWIAGQL
jgi:hypothetical protein